MRYDGPNLPINACTCTNHALHLNAFTVHFAAAEQFDT